MNIKILSVAAASLFAAGCAGTPDYYGSRDHGYDDRNYAYDDSRRDLCANCGTVERIEREYYGDGRRDRDDGTGGAVVGALVGAAIGNQVGSGNGRKAATVAGAIAGGVAGKHIDERNGSHGDEFEVIVRMDNGRTVILQQRDLDGVREGSRVVVNGGVARLQ